MPLAVETALTYVCVIYVKSRGKLRRDQVQWALGTPREHNESTRQPSNPLTNQCLEEARIVLWMGWSIGENGR